MNKILAGFGFLVAATLPSHGARHWEFDGFWSHSEYFETETDAFGAEATWFVDGLMHPADAPLLESAFVDRPRAVSFNFVRTEMERPNAEGNANNAGLTYTHRRTNSPHVFRTGYRNGATSQTQAIGTGMFSFNLRTETDEHEVLLEYGRYVRKRWLAGLRVTYEVGDREGS
ncbi:MAG: hypothetical protein ACREIA_18895, partial [Opitutaceae bacterium]